MNVDYFRNYIIFVKNNKNNKISDLTDGSRLRCPLLGIHIIYPLYRKLLS